MNKIILEKYTVKPSYKIPYPKWDTDNWAETPEEKQLYGSKTEIYIAAISGDPPTYAISEEGYEHAVSKLFSYAETKRRLEGSCLTNE